MSRSTSAKQLRSAWCVFLAALLLLSLNDFWFKTAGFLPGWVTGKLSDFAGLIVAPVALALLLGGRSLTLYRAGFALIALVFALPELSPACSDLLVGALGMLGLNWTLWADPTDLLALLVLPLAWRVSLVLARVGARSRARLLVFPAAVACLASGQSPIEMDAAMVVYNTTDRMIALKVAHIPWLDCAQLDQLGAGLIETGDFGAAEVVRLAPGAAKPLERRQCGCNLYRLSAGGRSTIVRVPEGSVEIDRHPTERQRRRHRDRMLIIAGDFSFAAGKAIETVEVSNEAKTKDCGVEPPAMAYTAPWMAQFSFNVMDMEVLSVEPVAGNCFGVEVQRSSLDPVAPGLPMGAGGAAGMPGAAGAAGGGAAGAAGGGGADGLAGAAGSGEEMSAPSEPFQLYLCAPIELFAFTVGDVVDIHGVNSDSSDSLTVRTDDRSFTLRLGEDSALRVQVEPGGCGPLRGDEAAPWLTAPVVVTAPVVAGIQTLVPGKVTSFEQADGTLDVYLGRSRRVLGCGVEEPDQPGRVSVEIVERWSR